MNNFCFIFFIFSLIEKIRTDSSNSDESNFWNDNIWLFVLLIILSISLVVIIIFISIKIYKKCKNSNSQENKNNFVNTERATQQYISDYDKNLQNNKKIKYKERPLKEIDEE